MHQPSNLITTLVFTAAVTLTACGGKSPEAHIQSAKEAILAADYKAATIELKSTLEAAPSNVEARLLLGQSFQAQEHWANSEKEFRKALELGASPEQVLPSLARALVHQGKYQQALDLALPDYGLGAQALASVKAERANAYMALGKPQEAAQAIEEGEKSLAGLGPTDISKDLYLAKAYLALINKQPGEALSLLDAILKKDSKFIEAMDMKAQLLLGDKKVAEAFKVYEQIVATNPKHFSAHLAIAGLHQRKGNLDAADKSVQAAEKIAPGSPFVLYARASIEFSRGNTRKANEAIQQVLKIRPDHLASRLIRATTSLELGNYEQSQKDAEYFLAQQPGNAFAARVLAANQLKSNNFQGALNTLTPLLKANANDVALLALLGEAHLKARDYNKAMEYLDRASKLDPKNAYIKSQQATGLLYQGETEQAITMLERAANLSEKPGQADITLILLKLSKQNYDQALQAIEVFEKKLPNNPVTHSLRASAYLGKKDPASARKSLGKALAADPKFFPAAATLATLDLQDKNPQAARSRFESILAHDQANVSAMLALAELAQAGKHDEEYLNWLMKAVKTNSKLVQPHQLLISYYLSKQQNAKALAQARDAVQQHPESPVALKLLGATQLATGDTNAALVTFKQMVVKAPDSSDTYYRLAMAQVAAKDRRSARISLQKAIHLQPGFIQAQDALIRLEMSEGKSGAALAVTKQMQMESPKATLGFEREGDIHLAQKRHSLAIHAYQRAIDLGAGTTGQIKLLHALNLSGDTRGAEQRLTTWIKQHPTDILARNFAAEFYTQAGRDQEAIIQYEAVQRLAPPEAALLNNLALLYQRMNDKRALGTAEQALKLAPDQPPMQDTLGWILLEQGQIPRALELLHSAASKAPKSATLRYHYAVALARSGKKAEAKKELEAAIASGQKIRELEAAKALLKSL
ncbi:MAG: PEP-CTERM system TPR-repeat protein PrsT [Hydrogenophilales bacterium CG17_big_fil_post_rev_8_21_14_2_50_63_12]|nr:MAG: PEP-CTERM system TPR-repeat protein PrsT [Hydrogenophilales bacterium CG17_big_fil_post_rev_8_21_14_2_50_63_12]